MTRFVRTISFRLTALYIGLFAASTAILFAIVYIISTASLHDQLRDTIDSEMTSFVARSINEPLDEFADETEEQFGATTGQPFHYSLRDSTGRLIAGDLADVEMFDGWRTLPYATVPDDGLDHELLALGRSLANGGHLVIAQDTFRQQEAEEAIARAFAWAAGATLLLALAGGVVLSRRFLRRIDDMNRTMHAIAHGDLASRIRIVGTDDELDQLGRNLNDMLDRLQGVMEGLRQVSNDIAHDLRTPLSRLKQHLEAAHAKAGTVEDYECAIEQAMDDADTALDTFGALLRIAQIESRTRRANFKEIDLSSLLTDLAMTYGAVTEDAGKRLHTNIAPNLHVDGDRELLTQLFVNLIENALRHTPDGARIDVSLRASHDGTVAEISDNGPGIAEAERANVFKRFYRLETSRSTPGSGLGLALVGAVADIHDAGIVLSDNDPGLSVSLHFHETTSR